MKAEKESEKQDVCNLKNVQVADILEVVITF